MRNELSNIEIEKIINHWKETSEEDFKTMLSLYSSKSYSWALFVGHISIEKLLKALYVIVHRKHAPFIHNLFRLAELCHLDITAEYSDWLDIITSFNINARYDDYKKEFYARCTPIYTSEWIEKIKILRQWINQKL